LDKKLKSHDLLLLTGINTLPFYINRFDHRPFLSLQQFFKKYHPTEAVPDPPGDPWVDLDALFQDAWKKHHRVWVLSELVEPENDWASRLEQMEKMPDGSLRNFFDQYDLTPVATQDKVYFYEVIQKKDDGRLSPKPLATPALAPVKKAKKSGIKP
jgi:hypothetical protein